MRSRPSIAGPFALGAALLLMLGCGPREKNSGEESGASSSQGFEGFFNPQEGETWKYRVQKEIPLDVELSKADQALRPERTDSGHLLTFERVRTCTGTKQVAAFDRELTAIDLFENGSLLGHELYDIGPNGVFFRGWIKAADPEPGELLAKGVRLATPDMQAGQSWEATGIDPNRLFQFRVIERTNLTVPAGSFDTVRIQITSDSAGVGLKRTIWFAENIGIVREETVSYGPQRTRVRETSELVHFMIPTQGPPSEVSIVSAPGDETPPDAAPVPEPSPADPGAESEPPPDGAEPAAEDPDAGNPSD